MPMVFFSKVGCSPLGLSAQAQADRRLIQWMDKRASGGGAVVFDRIPASPPLHPHLIPTTMAARARCRRALGGAALLRSVAREVEAGWAPGA